VVSENSGRSAIAPSAIPWEEIAANRTGNPACRLAGLGGYKHSSSVVFRRIGLIENKIAADTAD
jgi:hypothetical protein